MKKLILWDIFLALIIYGMSFYFTGDVQAKQIILDIPDGDIKIVENDVVDAEQWIRDAWNGKLNKSKERMLKQEINRSVGAGEVLPAGDAAIIQKAFLRPDYENRKERDAFQVAVGTPEVIISTK